MRNPPARLSSGRVILAVVACVGAWSCEPAHQPQAEPPCSPVAAEVDGQAIEVAEVEEAAGRHGGSRAEALEAVIRGKLAAAEARRRELPHRDPRLRAALEDLRRAAAAREERLLRDALFGSLREGVVLSEDELRQHYERTKARYFSRQLRLRVATRDSREAAADLDAELGAEGRLDAASSEEIGPAPVEDLPRTLLPAAYRIQQPGERTLVEADGAWWLVELIEVLPAVPRSFEESRQQVEESLRALKAREAFDALMARLRSSATVRIEEAALANDASWESRQTDSDGAND